MNKESTIMGVAGLIIGLLIGIMVGGKFMAAPDGSAAMPPQQQQHAGVDQHDHSQAFSRIAELEQVVAREPKNLQAWIQLGDDYFDTHQAQKSVQAYAKALELDPDNSNVLTDQGVMFRDLGFFDRALENFDKAHKIDPKHLQSLFNMGVVYAFDLKQNDKARAVFETILQKDQSSQLAQQARELLKQL